MIKPAIYTSSKMSRAYPLTEGTTFKIDGDCQYGVYDNLIYRLIPYFDPYNINGMSYKKSDIKFTFEEFNVYVNKSREVNNEI